MQLPGSPATKVRLLERYSQPKANAPPWDGIQFVEPVGSDELSDKLREAYPRTVYPGLTDQMRIYRATIEFFTEELLLLQSNSATPQAQPSPQPWRDPVNMVSDRSRPHSQSAMNSPLTSGSVSSVASPEHARSHSETAKIADPTYLAPKQGGGQQFVFSAQSGNNVRPKSKRKMTKEERGDYKAVRQRGACEKCRKHKSKCTHEDDSQVHVKSGTKRRTSMQGELDRFDAPKVLKMEDQAEVHGPCEEIPLNSNRSMSQPSLPDVRMRPQVDPTEPVLHNELWNGDDRYVSQITVDPSDTVLNEWLVFSSPGHPVAFTNQFVGSSSMSPTHFPSPVVHAQPSVYPYQGGAAQYNQWDGSQPHHGRNISQPDIGRPQG